MDRWWADPASARSVALSLQPDDDPQMLAGAAVYVLRGIARESMLAESARRAPNLASALERVGNDDLIGPICKAFDDASGIEGYGAARVAAIKRDADAGARMLVSSMVGAKVPVFVAIRKAAEFYPLPVSRAARVAGRIGRPDADGELMLRMSDHEVSWWVSELASAEASSSVAKSLEQDDFFVTRGGKRSKRTVMRDEGGRFASQGGSGDAQFAGYFDRIKGLRQQKAAQAAGRQGRKDPRAGDPVRRAQEAAAAEQQKQQQEKERSTQEARQQRLERLNRLGRMGGIGARAEAALAAELGQAQMARSDAVAAASAEASNRDSLREDNIREMQRKERLVLAAAKHAGKRAKSQRRMEEEALAISAREEAQAEAESWERRHSKAAGQEDVQGEFNKLKAWRIDDPISGTYSISLTQNGQPMQFRAIIPMMVRMQDNDYGDQVPLNPIDVLSLLTGVPPETLSQKWSPGADQGTGPYEIELTTEGTDTEVAERAVQVAKLSTDLYERGARSDTAADFVKFLSVNMADDSLGVQDLLCSAALISLQDSINHANKFGTMEEVWALRRASDALLRVTPYKPSKYESVYSDVGEDGYPGAYMKVDGAALDDLIGDETSDMSSEGIAEWERDAALAFSKLTLDEIATLLYTESSSFQKNTALMANGASKFARAILINALSTDNQISVDAGSGANALTRQRYITVELDDGRIMEFAFDEDTKGEELANDINDFVDTERTGCRIETLTATSRAVPTALSVSNTEQKTPARAELINRAYQAVSDPEQRLNLPLVPVGFAKPSDYHRSQRSQHVGVDFVVGKYADALRAQQNSPTFNPYTGDKLEAADG